MSRPVGRTLPVVERIALDRATTKRRRGLEEVAVVLTQGDTQLQGAASVRRGESTAEAAVKATIQALGERAPSVQSIAVERVTAGPVRIMRVTVRSGDELFEGSCSMAERTLGEAAARAALDALNPTWGT